MKLLFSICSEIDILFKTYIEYNGWFLFNKKGGNMGRYREIINENLENFPNEVVILSKQIELKPFIDWKNDQAPDWWNVYNDLKHNRTFSDNYQKLLK